MTRNQLAALNAAGEALRSLDMGACRMRYRPADHMIPRDTFQFWIDATDHQREAVGTGETPADAMFAALNQHELEAA